MTEEKRLKKVLNTGDINHINKVFEEIYNTYKGLIYFIVSKYIKSKDDVLDIVQDVFVDFFNNCLNVNNIKSYLSIMAKNKALNFLKKNNRIVIVDDKSIDLLDSKNIYDNYIFTDVMKVLKEKLNDIEYQILVLHLLENLTFKDISNKLNVKEPSIKTIYFRCIKKSLKYLKEVSL